MESRPMEMCAVGVYNSHYVVCCKGYVTVVYVNLNVKPDVTMSNPTYLQ